MRFSYRWLKDLINFRKSPQILAELLCMRSFEVEEAQKLGKDWALDVKIPANRISDAGNHLGLAQELGAILNLKIKRKNPKLQIKNQHYKNQPLVKIKISKPEICPRYTAWALEIKTLGKSPPWMQERLAVCGFRPINGVVDVTNYVMLEMGQPLHAFDLAKISGGEINIREAKEGEKLLTLDGARHILRQGTIIIEDSQKIIDLAGIMGGANSAVSAKTQKILLQAAVFDPIRIYKTIRALRFKTPAAEIYSAGIDTQRTLPALKRAVELLQKLEIVEGVGEIVDIYLRPDSPRKFFFRPDFADRIIGQKLDPQFYRNVFKRLGFKIKIAERNWIIETPASRQDIQLPEDLAEEAARIYGYEKLKSVLPQTAILAAPQNEALRWQKKAAEILVGLGFSESQLYEFTGERELNQFFQDSQDAVEIENPVNPEARFLLPRLIIKYVVTSAKNLENFDSIKIFGVGKTFKLPGNSAGVLEQNELILIISRKGSSGEEEFYEMKGVIDQILAQMGITEYWYDDQIKTEIRNKELRIFHPYRLAEIKIEDEKVGNMGEIHPEILKNIKAKARIVAAEINFDKLWRLARKETEYLPIGKYPAILRDISLIVPENTRSLEVQNLLENLGGKLLVDTDLFDYFQDEMMRERGQKSLAFHLIFQSPERTLKDEEVNKITEQIVAALKEKGWEVRK